MKNVPNTVYLQIDADGETPENFNGLETTWSSTREYPNDIEYTLSEIHPSQKILRIAERILGEFDEPLVQQSTPIAYFKKFEDLREALEKVVAEKYKCSINGTIPVSRNPDPLHLYDMLKEHPEYPHDDWRHEVYQQDTSLGYHEWVMRSIELNRDE